MEPPTHQFYVDDPARGVKHVVHSYRQLTADEALFAVRYALANKKGKRLRKGQRIEILTQYGLRD